MRNQYPGICYRCGETVPAKQGHFERHIGAWRVQHASCAIKYRGTNHNKESHGNGRNETGSGSP